MKDYSKEMAYIFALIQACKNATSIHGLNVDFDIEGDKVYESFIKFVHRVEVMHEQLCKEFIIDEYKECMQGRELLSNKLLSAMYNGKVYFRWTDVENDNWKELTAYTLLANTFENAEFKFETIISSNDITRGKVLTKITETGSKA